MSEHFNYISYGNYELLDESVTKFRMSRGRMFEYTPVDIEKRLELLSANSVDYLEKLPTFICSEISTDASMMIRFGNIRETRADRKEVSTEFQPVIEFGKVIFESVDAARTLVGADGFQLYRTHWAVRQGDVSAILRDLAALKPEALAAVQQYLGPDEEDAVVVAELPARTKNIIGEANSIESLLALLYNQSLPGNENFFRGHEDQTFELTPSVLRKWPGGAWKHMPIEDRLCNELLIAHYDEFQGDQYCFDRLVRMQHYELPTRLLDISGNPLIALFFACSSPPHQMDIPGEIIVFRIKQDRIKYYDSDTVSCLANLSKLTMEQKSAIDLTQGVSDFNKQPPVKKLLHHIKSEKGYFEGRILPEDLGSVICVKAKRTNSRIKSQSGAFLLFGHDVKLPEGGNEGIEILRITVENKRHILAQLDSININATTVYPSIDQTAVHLRARYEQPDT